MTYLKQLAFKRQTKTNHAILDYARCLYVFNSRVIVSDPRVFYLGLKLSE